MHTIFCVSFELIPEYNFQHIPHFDGSYNPLKIALFRIEGKDKIKELIMLIKASYKMLRIAICFPLFFPSYIY